MDDDELDDIPGVARQFRSGKKTRGSWPFKELVTIHHGAIPMGPTPGVDDPPVAPGTPWPFPTRTVNDSAVPEPQQSPTLSSVKHAAGSAFGDRADIADGLNRLRLRLLDLTSRNRLLNFRHSATKTIRITGPALQPTYEKLTAGQSLPLTAVPEPKASDYEQPVDGPARKPRAEEFARVMGFPHEFEESADLGHVPALRALFYPDDLERVMRKVSAEARTAIEETGSNFLHLIFGFLEYTESDDSQKTLLAPLVAVPVTLVRGALDTTTRTYRYELSFSGEDITDNLSLREKLTQDFRLRLPDFDVDENNSLDDYLRDVARAVKHKHHWAVRRFLTLAPLSFGKMLLVRDLDPQRWPGHADGSNRLQDHEVVRMVFEGRAPSDGLDSAPDYDLDNHPEEKLALICDADSSQHSALIDALAGKNIVIEGPPGTGKSQTITNLIAAAMQRGKKVLFVAEKLAALEVVKKRLESAGLGGFCLELHGTKTSKQKVLDAIRTRINRRFRTPVDFDGMVRSLEQQKRRLTQYAVLIRSRVGNAMGLTIHDVIWASERHRLALGRQADSVATLKFANVCSYGRADVDRLTTLGAEVGQQLATIEAFNESNPWWGFYPAQYVPGDEVVIVQLLGELQLKLQDLLAKQQSLAAYVDSTDLLVDAESSEKLHKALRKIDASGVDGALAERIFASGDTQSNYQALLAWGKLVEEARALSHEAAHHVDAAAQLDREAVEKYEAAYRDAMSHGLSQLTVEQAGSHGFQWRDASDKLAGAHRTFEPLATVAGVPFAGCVRDVFVLSSVAEIAAGAPMAFLPYRTAMLGNDEAALLTEQLKHLYARLTGERGEIREVLHLDMPVTLEQVVRSIRTLRQGDAWYRVFQSEWRNAVKLHRSLSRRPKKRKAAERCAELEQFARHLQARQEFASHPRFRLVFGALFEGEKTDVARIERLVRWLVSSRAQLARLHVPARSLDVVTVPESVIAEIAAFKDEAHFYRDVISQLRIAFQQPANDRGGFASDDQLLAKLSSELAKSAGALANCSRAVGNAARPESTLNAIHVALGQRTRAQQLRRAAADDVRVAALLGSYFVGADSSLVPVARASAFVAQLNEWGVPAAVRQRLLRADIGKAKTDLTSLADALVLQWRNVAVTESELKRYAAIQLEQWGRVQPTDPTFVSCWAQQVRKCSGAIELLPEWARYVNLRREAIQSGLQDLVSALEEGTLSAGSGGVAVRHRIFANLAQELYLTHPDLRRHGSAKLDTLRSEFAKLDREIITLRGLALAKEISTGSNPPGGLASARVDDKTEMALIQHLLPQTRPRVPVRQLLRRGGRSVQELMPCFMMGPQAVAQYLAPGVLHFDLIVMDEASQLKPEEAIGAIARGSQLVVVGDPKQLPPTSFFDRYDTVDDDSDAAIAAADVPSILDVCMGHFSPIRRLKWHYRSRHESLIAFSNHHFYDNDLIVFPSPYPRSGALGVKYQYVRNGVYESQMNKPEAVAVVQAVVDHILKRPDDSLGVVTLNLKQRDLIEELLEQRFKNLDVAEHFKLRWEKERLPLFVKNLENVQGDERDTIFISTTFGPALGTSVVRQNFGPISRDNGWRRLNVLFTRARKTVRVFSSMKPGDIVVDASTRRGTRALANYLHYASTGVISAPDEPGASTESDFESAVKTVLESAGYEVVPQLGVAGFRIDLAVRHPVHTKLFMAAIECDGASYHTGKSVRDRDRIRQEILESLGWKNRIYRIWSTDWFESSSRQTQRLLAYLDSAKDLPLEGAFLHVEPEPVDFELGEMVATSDERQLSVEFAEQAARFVQEAPTELADVLVEAGDTVTYAVESRLTEPLTVQIREDARDLAHGVIPIGAPLAQAMLSAEVGDVVTLRVPGKPPQDLLVLRIVKSDGRTVSLD